MIGVPRLVRIGSSLLVGGIALAAGGCSVSTPPPAKGQLAELRFLAGCWSALDAETGVWTEECWSEPAADGMIGTSRSVRNDRTTEFELLRIVEDDKGVAYLASPGGRQPPTEFRMRRLDASAVSFENPDHDFPRAIAYESDGNWLRVSIEGEMGGQEARMEWRLHRTR